MPLKLLLLTITVAVLVSQAYPTIQRRGELGNINNENNEKGVEFEFIKNENQTIDWVISSAKTLQKLTDELATSFFGNQTIKPLPTPNQKDNDVINQFGNFLNNFKTNLDSLTKNITGLAF